MIFLCIVYYKYLINKREAVLSSLFTEQFSDEVQLCFMSGK